METVVADRGGMVRMILVVPAIILAPVLGAVVGLAARVNNPGRNVLTHRLSEPLEGATTAKVDINVGTGNLTIDRLAGGEPVLATGTLQYFEGQGQPTRRLNASRGQADLTLKAVGPGRPSFRLPWAASNGAFEWQIHLNPAVASDITAHSDGGNMKLDLAGMAITRLAADSGGGNLEVVLPEGAANVSVAARTGGGNVTVLVPGGLAARVHATSGLGKVIVDPRFAKTDDHTYESPDYGTAANKVEITASSGAGNVRVITK